MIEEVLRKFPRRITLKNGKAVTVKPLEPSDFQELVRFFQEDVKDEDVAFLKDNVKDPEVIKSWCLNINPERVFAVVAVNQGKIIANASLHMRSFGWAKFLGKLRITTSTNWRGIGLGKSLIKILEEVARELMLETLWAEMVEGAQDAAVRAFEKSGFTKAGTLKNIAADPQGKLHNLLIYIKRL